MSQRTPVAACLLFSLLCGAAYALLSAHTKPLESWIHDRSGDLRDPLSRTERRPAQALQRAAKDLGKESDRLSSDAKLMARALGRLAKPFADEGELATVMDGVVAAFEADLHSRRTSYAALPGRLTAEKLGARIVKRLRPVDSLGDKAVASSDPVRRMKFIAKAFARLDRVDRTAEPVAADGDDRFLLVLGPNNSPIRVFVADRQTDATTLVASSGPRVRTAWEQGDTPGVPGNYQLVINWDDTDEDLVVDTARVQLFRLIGVGEAPEAWYLKTFTLGLAYFGISFDETPHGTRVKFDGVELAPDAGTNGAGGTVRLHGRLLLRP
jgi:hypothetical protein